jgi:hypothetical protein
MNPFVCFPQPLAEIRFDRPKRQPNSRFPTGKIRQFLKLVIYPVNLKEVQENNFNL